MAVAKKKLTDATRLKALKLELAYQIDEKNRFSQYAGERYIKIQQLEVELGTATHKQTEVALAQIRSLNDEVSRLMDIVRWQINPETAVIPQNQQHIAMGRF